jgi:hypothetical protein
MRMLRTPLDNILSLISCAETYGYKDDVLMDGFAGMMGRKLSDKEILQYARTFTTPKMIEKGFGKEDEEAVISKLMEFKKQYIKETDE